jgi:hypothetical protein
MPVKFDGGVSISVLRNKQLFKKSSHFQKAQTFLIFKTRLLEKGQALKSLSFLDLIFLVKRMNKPTSNLT